MRRTAAHVRPRLLAATITFLLTIPAPADAQIDLVDRGGLRIAVGGYARWLALGHDPRSDVAGAGRSLFQAGVSRLRWTARGGGWLVELHERLGARWNSEPLAPTVLGFGVSAVPTRWDLESVLVDRELLRVAHDVDRLALTVYMPLADVTIGRQAVTWGWATLFPVADLWSRFGPYELETEEKPGLDALRALAYPAERLVLDLVAADRGAARDASVGARLAVSLPSGDLYIAAAKLWRELVFIGGAALVLEEVKLRGEAVLPRGLDRGGWHRPRVTAGADWVRGRWTLSGELHYNGIGTDSFERYPAVLLDPRVARGESYFLGRWYAGAAGGWSVTDRLTLSASLLANLLDPSASLSPVATWDLGRRGRVSAGALLTAGERPYGPKGSIPTLPSEFGAYGHLLFAQAGIYF